MSTFDKPSCSLESFSGVVRLFPLPNLVLFPHVMQPLHLFEPRYRTLLEDALEDDRLITMALLEPGWENDYEGQPPIHPMACLGQIAMHHSLEDGTYNLLLLGVQRVRLVRELDLTQGFRTAKVELCEDYEPLSHAPEGRALPQRLREAFLMVAPMLPEVQEQFDHLLGAEVPLGVLTDVIGYMLDIDLDAKQRLLEELDVGRRAELLIEHLTAAANCPASAETVQFPPSFSAN